MDMGVDFGSTYTTVSIYNQKDKAPEAQRVSGQNDSTYVPSVVSVDKKGKFRYGVAAKNRTGESGARVFKAFKMLLNESDQERLKRRKYTEEYTPYAVTHKFLEYLLGKVRNQYNQNEKIEHLVVGVPEIWFEQLNTMDGQAIVREICQSFDFVDSTNVRVVSEPIAASAFFAHNYQKLKDKCYEGKIFLIDYGGGTLDITLTDVTVKDEYMTIKIDERCGKGENEEGKIGKAGILYMESVVEEALVCNEIPFSKENLGTDDEYMKAVNFLEQELKSCADDIEFEFETACFTGKGENVLDQLDNDIFTTVTYDGEDIDISYGLLLRVYNREIREILNEKLDYMISFMKSKDIDYESQEKFKIVLVGGFGNFYLVRKQVEEKFDYNTTDHRWEDVIVNTSDREEAISLGAALLAANEIGIKNTAPYSLGLYMEIGKKPVRSMAFEYRDNLDYDKVYKVMRNGKPVTVSGRSLTTFVINGEDSDGKIRKVPVRAENQKELQNVIQSEQGTVQVGFSIDPREVLTLHIWDYNILTNTVCEPPHTIKLKKFRDLLDLDRAEVVDL